MAWPLAPRRMWTVGTTFQTLTQPCLSGQPAHQSAELAPGPARGHSPTVLGPLSPQIMLSQPPRQGPSPPLLLGPAQPAWAPS